MSLAFQALVWMVIFLKFSDSRQMLAVIVCVDMFEHGLAQDLIWLVVWNIFFFHNISIIYMG